MDGIEFLGESEEAFEEAETQIRDQIYEDMHTPIINRLRVLGLEAVRTLKEADSTASFRAALAEIDPEVRGIIREIRRVVAPSWYALDSTSRDKTLERFVEDLDELKQRFNKPGEMEVDLHYSEVELKLLTPRQFLQINDILLNLMYNAKIHAQASKILVHLHAGDEKPPQDFKVIFTSDGVGHNGLNHIREFVGELPESCRGLRAVVQAVDRMGAAIQVTSSPVDGTTYLISGISLSEE